MSSNTGWQGSTNVRFLVGFSNVYMLAKTKLEFRITQGQVDRVAPRETPLGNKGN
jgi:hypothetical protein